MPGTIRDYKVVGRSTRLGMRQAVNVSEYFATIAQTPCLVFSDTHAHAYGEMALHSISKEDVAGTFAFILVDEGVGLALFIDGKLQSGAGSAGVLGRLIVEPAGEYHDRFAARGALVDVTPSSPWVSRRILTAYLSEVDKARSEGTTETDIERRLVTAAQQRLWNDLDIATIASAYQTGDRVVSGVLDEAAHYLGLALQALITIVNPPLIMLSGGMICNVPAFADDVIAYARRYSWGAAWNRTRILQSSFRPETLGLGAVELFRHTQAGTTA